MQNGRIYHDLNNMTMGELARSLGYPQPLAMPREQGMFQYLMETKGYFLENVLARPSAQQAYNILKTEGLSPETSRYLLESNGYFADNLLELPSVAESGADLQSPGLKWYGTDLFPEGEVNQNRVLVREEAEITESLGAVLIKPTTKRVFRN